MEKFNIEEYVKQIESRLPKEKKKYNKRQIWNETSIPITHPIINKVITIYCYKR